MNGDTSRSSVFFNDMSDVRIWVDKETIMSIKANTLTEEQTKGMIMDALEEAGWREDNEDVKSLEQALIDFMKSKSKPNIGLPVFEYFESKKGKVKYGIYPKDPLNWLVDEMDILTRQSTLNAVQIVDNTGWQKNRDRAFEREVTETVHEYEKSKGFKPQPILHVYKKGTIFNHDGQDLCQLDGLFQREDGTWVVCEAKSHLTSDELAKAEKTVDTFQEYVQALDSINVPQNWGFTENKSYWTQIKAFQDINKKSTVVKYLGYRVSENRINQEKDPSKKALELGFTLVEPMNNNLKVRELTKKN